MARPKRADDFVVPVEGIGTFTFAKRNMRLQIAVDVEYARLTEGMPEVPPFLDAFCRNMAELKVLTVEAPEDWNPEELDPNEDGAYGKLLSVWSALREKERTFRTHAAPGSETARPAA